MGQRDVGDVCDVFFPRASLDIGGLSETLVILGDETLTGLAYVATFEVAAATVGTVVTVLGTVGTVALLLAVISYINLTTARA